MKALSKVALLGLVAGLFVTATGCGQEGLPAGKTPEDVIKEALLNQNEISQSIFELEMKADLKGEVDGEKNSLKGSFNISGTQADDKMSVKMSIDGKMNDESVKGALELRTNKDGVFAIISGVEISEKETQEMIDLMLADYMGQWIKLSFIAPSDVLDSGDFANIDYSPEEELPFTNIQYKGTVDVLGVKSYHFTADMDEKKLLSMFDAAEDADVDRFLNAVEMSGDIYVAVKEMMLTGFGGKMNLSDPEMSGTIDLSFKMNPTKSNDVKTPDYKKELTEEDIAMLMFGGAMMGPSDYGDYDSGDFDDYNMEDYDFEDFDFETEEF